MLYQINYKQIISFDNCGKKIHELIKEEFINQCSLIRHWFEDINDSFNDRLSSNLFDYMTIDRSRTYHNPLHVITLFQVAHENDIQLHPDEQLAIIFHDVVYDPNSKLNEHNSVAYMDFLLRSRKPKDQQLLFQTESIIRNTARHLEDFSDENIYYRWQLILRNDI